MGTSIEDAPWPLWQPGRSEEKLEVARLGLIVRRESRASEMLAAMSQNAEWLAERLADLHRLPGRYLLNDPSAPLECTIRIPQADQEEDSLGATVIEGWMGETQTGGVAIEVDDWWQDDQGQFQEEGVPLAVVHTGIDVLPEETELTGFAILQLRERAKSQQMPQRAERLALHLAVEARKKADARARPYELLAAWAECSDCRARRTEVTRPNCSACGKGWGAPTYRVRVKVGGDVSALFQDTELFRLRSGRRGDTEIYASLTGAQGDEISLVLRSRSLVTKNGVILPSANVAVFQAQSSVCRELGEGGSRTSLLAACLEEPSWRGPLDSDQTVKPLETLNPEQVEAVRKIVGMRPGQIYLIEGPPGTGKTASIVEAIRLILERQPQTSILLSSHSNDAVDAGQRRLLSFKQIRQVRLAVPEKVPESLRHTVGNGQLHDFNLIAGTCNRLAMDPDARTRVYDWLILDEANKVRPGEALALMALSKRWVLIGDPNQLPPVVEVDAVSYKIQVPLDTVVRDESFYGWFWQSVPPEFRLTLRHQYRMRDPIGRLVSRLFYANTLIHEAPYPRLPLSWPFDREIVWIDTGAQTEYRDAEKSVTNQFEVAICRDIVSVIRAQSSDAQLAVISMYAGQVKRLTSALKGLVEAEDIQSVDAFEGREADGVILSLVRSNPTAKIGFLNSRPRVNVAISRAKKLLVIVGDSSTITQGGRDLFVPILSAARGCNRVVGVGAAVTACGNVGVGSAAAAFRQRRKRHRRPRVSSTSRRP